MAPSGTDLIIGLKGREAKSDDGDFTEKGRGGNLPCGEVFISPELGTSKGVIGFDGSISLEGGEIMLKVDLLLTSQERRRLINYKLQLTRPKPQSKNLFQRIRYQKKGRNPISKTPAIWGSLE
jgi:hypothetical protein